MAYWLEGASVRPEARLSPRLRAVSKPLDTTRARLRSALAVTIAVAVFLSFILFPVRRFNVEADGQQMSVVSRQHDVSAVLGLAGIQSQAGDVVMRAPGEVRVERAVPVVVRVDGRLLSWRTRATTVQALVDEMGIEVGPYDGVTVNGSESVLTGAIGSALDAPRSELQAADDRSGEVKLDIVRAVPLTIVEDGHLLTLKSPRPTVAMALRDAGIRLGPADEVYPGVSAPVIAGLEVAVKHAKTVNLRIGGATRVIYTHKETLKDVLAEAGLQLGAEDRVEPAVDVSVANGMTARLVRVAGRTFTEREPVKRKTVFRADENLTGFHTRMTQGSDGSRVSEYKVVIEDGVEREKTLIRSYMEPETVDNVIYYSASTTRQTGNVPQNYTVVTSQRMWATWYNASSSGRPATDPWYGITATGVPVTRGIVAVDPELIPLGSKLFIPGYGFAVAADTGGAIKGNVIDLGFADGEYADWRTGWTDVYLLAP